MDRGRFFAAIGAVGAGFVVPTAALAEWLEHRMIEPLEPQGRQERELKPMPESPLL